MILGWLRRWRERDYQHLVKRDAPLPADRIDEPSPVRAAPGTGVIPQ
jgi:hypothetical protein